MKEDLMLFYKIGKSRQVRYDFNRNVMTKSYFTIRMTKLLPIIDVIVNIDEAWFFHKTSTTRSWLRRGMDKTITNIKYSGTLSLILAITSSGWTFNATVTGNINSNLFIKYLKEILRFLEEKHKTKKERILILLDNATSHRAKVVKKFLDSWGSFVAFIPPYSPELAPVEKYFRVLKNRVNKSKATTIVNLKLKEGVDFVSRCIKLIELATIRMWSTFFREIQSWLDHLSNYI